MSTSMNVEAETTDRAIQAKLSRRQQAYTVPDLIDELDTLARTLQVRPLSQFIQLDAGEYDEMTDAMEQEGFGKPTHPRPDPTAWHEPAAGLATVRALLDHIEQHPELVEERWPGMTHTDIDDLVPELQGFEKVLRWLESKPLRFRFDWS